MVQADALANEFDAWPSAVVREMWTGGVNLPWNLAAAALAGFWLMFTRLTLGAEGGMANADHVIGALALTVISLAAAEMARPLRFLLIPLGGALLITPLIYDANAMQAIAGIACGLALIALSLRRGAIRERYGEWQKVIV